MFLASRHGGCGRNLGKNLHTRPSHPTMRCALSRTPSPIAEVEGPDTDNIQMECGEQNAQDYGYEPAKLPSRGAGVRRLCGSRHRFPEGSRSSQKRSSQKRGPNGLAFFVM